MEVGIYKNNLTNLEFTTSIVAITRYYISHQCTLI